MPKSRNRKNHKQKLNARKNTLAKQREMQQKYQREMIKQIIEAEKAKSLDEAQVIGGHDDDNSIDPILNGPSI